MEYFARVYFADYYCRFVLECGISPELSSVFGLVLTNFAGGSSVWAGAGAMQLSGRRIYA
jgi:hypothetical protein